MTNADRIKLLLELGEADHSKDWPDYLQYGFVETDVPALMDLIADETFDREAIDDIRKFFAKNCVDITCAGDLEEVEIEEQCDGFLRGVNLWGTLTAADAAVIEQCIQPIRLFATEAGFTRLETMSEDDVVEQQQLI